MKTNTSEIAYKNKQLCMAFIEPEGFNEQTVHEMTQDELIRELNEYDEAIAECHAMFLYAKDMNNQKEMTAWRKMEQETKTEKRLMMKKFMKNKEVAVA